MCTLTYLPQLNGFTIFHTRDEVPERHSPDFPIQEKVEGHVISRPLDSRSGGSWFITSTEGVTGCVLNGAFEKHQRNPPYRYSRGKVLLDLMEARDKKAHLNTIDYTDIEPFTLVVFFDNEIMELRWDGEKKHIKAIDSNKPQIWSSATLYEKDIALERASWYHQWLQTKGTTSETLEHFHHHGGKGDPENDIIMKRSGGPCSVSITSLIKEDSKGIFCFEDLIKGNKNCVELTYG